MTPQEYLDERERINGREVTHGGAYRLAAGDVEPKLRLDPNVLVFGREITTVGSADQGIQLMIDVVFVDPETHEPVIEEPVTLPLELFQLERTYEAGR